IHFSVNCGSDWVPTSQLQRSHGGWIRDFSIGGDRLFALHRYKDIFDVWETPRPYRRWSNISKQEEERNRLQYDSAITDHFIDGYPNCFGVLLDLLRTGELYIPPKIDRMLLYSP
uniref:At2g24240-like C-terminal beta-propeller domain-containing protein n=1 Tax=Solanum lycopersicum TaxID=4081 RepID=A0A3Q7J3F3_SOLLC